MGNSDFSKYSQFLSVGAEIAAAILLPIVLGYWLDNYFNTSPWLILTGCILGIVNVMIVIFRLADRLNK